MFVKNYCSTSIVTPRYHNPTEQTITWHAPIFGSVLLLILALFIKLDKPKLPKMDLNEKCTFVYDQIADFLQEKDFGKRGYNFFKKSGTVGYCISIHNDKSNDPGQIRFTLNLGIITDSLWLEHRDFKKTEVVPKFPKVTDCVVRERIGNLLATKEDKWYCISSCTNVMKLLNEIECDITEYALPFFARYNRESDIVPNQFIYRKGGKR